MNTPETTATNAFGAIEMKGGSISAEVIDSWRFGEHVRLAPVHSNPVELIAAGHNAGIEDAPDYVRSVGRLQKEVRKTGNAHNICLLNVAVLTESQSSYVPQRDASGLTQYHSRDVYVVVLCPEEASPRRARNGTHPRVLYDNVLVS